MSGFFIAWQVLAAIYFLGAVLVAIQLKHLGWRRFLPLAAILSLQFPFAFLVPHIPELRIFLTVFLPIFGFAMIFYTLRLTCSGTHWTERTLRILSGAFLLIVVGFLFAAGLP